MTPSEDATATTNRPTLFKMIYESLPSDNVNKLDNSNKLSMLLKDNIVFLKEKINKKGRVMDSLLSQLSKKNYLTL